MTLFEQLERSRELLTESEEIIRGLRDNVDTNEQKLCNSALRLYAEIRDQLYIIDRSLEG